MQVPELDIDKRMLDRYQRKVGVRGRLERRIVANLIRHLDEAGFPVRAVDDGEECTDVDLANPMKAAMELIFNLDDCIVFFRPGVRNWVRLVLGNGIDIVSDWCIASKKFDEAMNAFDPEKYA